MNAQHVDLEDNFFDIGGTSVLLVAVERHASSPAVRAALEKALKSVQSDGDYRRVSAALLRQPI